MPFGPGPPLFIYGDLGLLALRNGLTSHQWMLRWDHVLTWADHEWSRSRSGWALLLITGRLAVEWIGGGGRLQLHAKSWPAGR